MADPTPRLVGSITEAEIAEMDEDDAWASVRRMRWPSTNGSPVCPKCGSHRCSLVKSRRRCHCHDCDHMFSPLSGTTFHGFKGGYLSFLKRYAYEGPINKASCMSAKTALDMRRRKIANEAR